MIAVGVDTHKERHYAVALDLLGQLLGELSVTASSTGYAELQGWAESLGQGQQLLFGIEGAGSWGAGLCQHLQQAGHLVGEVERPRRADRRTGKSDRIDALAAAKSALRGESVSTPRGGGILQALRALLIVRRSAVAERTRVLNQLQALNATAPVELRERVGAGTGKQLERRVLAMRARAVKADRKLGHSRRLKTRPPRRVENSELRGERPSSRGRARRARRAAMVALSPSEGPGRFGSACCAGVLRAAR